MPRSLVFGNGRILVQLDASYVIRDLFWPHVGQFNHLNGFRIRFGVWVDGQLAWSDDPGWTRDLRYEPGTSVGASILRHEHFGLEITIREAVLSHDDVFLREMRIENLREDSRTVRLFFNHDLRINESDIGDTAMWQPYLEGMVHFKQSSYFLFGGRSGAGGVDQFTTGYKGFNGHDGTWRDAEDGELASKTIEQGAVDSTMRLTVHLDGRQTGIAYYWIIAGESFETLDTSWDLVRGADLGSFLEARSHQTHAWGRTWEYGDPSESKSPTWDAVERDWLSPRVHDLVTRSLHIIDAETDHEGAILAATDSDILQTNRATYCYMWPRDGALVAMATDLAGYPSIARRYLAFCRPLLTPRQPYFLHKYGPDGTFGATWHPWIWEGQPEVPYQEDETALTLLGLCEHVRMYDDLALGESLWAEFARPGFHFLSHSIHPETSLPRPSWDLWEERRGVHAYTVASVIAALRAGATLAEQLRHFDEADRYADVAERMLDGLRTHMVRSDTGAVARSMVEVDEVAHYRQDATVDTASLSMGLFGVLPWADPIMQATLREVTNRTQIHGGIGGFARYENDYYFRCVEGQPGNPWVICTLWYAQAQIQMATELAQLDIAAKWLEWAADRATGTLSLAEQFHPTTGEPLSVSPLTWSHAEVVRTAMMALAKHKALRYGKSNATSQLL